LFLRPAILRRRAGKLHDDLADTGPPPMFDQTDRLPRSEQRPFKTEICREVAVSMVLTLAGMSSGPSLSWVYPALSGARRSSAVVKSVNTEGSAFF
jgi:hypothetical protein